MKRAGPQNPGVSLFPFLAVLICTMGVMMLLLVVCNRPGSDSGATDSSAHAADSEAEIAAARNLLSWKIAQLTDARKKTEADLEDRRLRLSAVEDHMRSLRDEWDRMHHADEDLEHIEHAKGEAVRLTEAEIAELKQQVERAKGQVAQAADRARHRPPSFAIIPYDGQSGTRRRPIYIECGPDRVTIEPEGIVLTIEDFEGPSGAGNPLATVLRAVRDTMAANGAAGGAQGEPYPLLIVRPDGIDLFYGARAAMASWASEFGYELVEQDRKLTYPPPNPQLAEVERTALADARARYAWFANTSTGGKQASGPRPMYRASVTGGGIVRDGQASGDGSGGPLSEFGGRRTGFGGPGGNATGIGGPGAGGPGVGGTGIGGTGVGGTGLGGPGSDAAGQPLAGSLANWSGRGSGFGGPGIGGPAVGGTGMSGTGVAGGGMAGTGMAGTGMAGVGVGGTGVAGPGIGGQGFGGSGKDVGGQGSEVGTPGGYGNPQMASLPPNSTIAPGGVNQETYGTLGGVPTANPTASGYAASSSGNGGGSNGGAAADGGGPTTGGGPASGDGAASGNAGPGGMISVNGGTPEYRDSNSPTPDIRPTPPSGPHPGEFVDSQPYTPPPKPKDDDPEKKPKSLADKRGQNWSLPSAAKISVPVTRAIHIECRGDQLVILPDPGNPDAQVVPFSERTEDSIDKLVAGVWKHTKGWGIAGRQMYWHPVLLLQLGPSGEGRFNEVQALMANSGLEVQRR